MNATVSLNMDNEHDFEDKMLYKVESIDVHTTRWKDPKMLKAMHI
jgi:hypothetical protein